MSGYYGAPVMSFETQTEKGIRMMSNALILAIVAAVLSMISSMASLALIGQITSGDYSSLMAGVLALVCGVLVLYLVVVILGLIGFSYVYKGKMEFGPAHEGNAGKALWMLVAAIIFFFSSFIVAMFVGVSAGLTGATDTALLGASLIGIVTEVFSILYSVAVALLLFFVVKALIPPEKSTMAILAATLYILSSVIGIVLGFVLTPSADFLDNPLTVSFNPIWFLPGIISGILGLIALVLFLVLYRESIARLKSRQYTPGFQPPMMQPQYQQQFQDQQMRWQPPPSP